MSNIHCQHQVAFLVRDVWRGVSTVTLFEHGDQAGRSGAARDLAGLVLTRCVYMRVLLLYT